MKQYNKRIRIILLTIVMIMSLSLSACSSDTSGNDDSTPTETAGLVKVEITMESGGVIELELDRSAAPITVENFVKLAEDGFYDGLTFHRIIPGFMIQGGDPKGTGAGGSDKSIKGEFADNGHENPISHERGVISMARRGNDNDSATCQFFITNADSQRSLDGQYAAFGHVTSGMDVVDEISEVDTDGNDKPLEDVVIKTIRVIG